MYRAFGDARPETPYERATGQWRRVVDMLQAAGPANLANPKIGELRKEFKKLIQVRKKKKGVSLA